MKELEKLSALIRERNSNGERITSLIHRPALIGHVGEYIAAKLFSIHLEEAATAKGFDGRFSAGTLAGKTVNVKWYAKREGLLDIRLDAIPDYYLVLAGPRANATHSRGESRPWLVESVHLFRAESLIATLSKKVLRLGIATSINRELWDNSEVYPAQNCPLLLVNAETKGMLALFGAKEQGLSVNVDGTLD